METDPCTEIALIRDRRPFGVCLAKRGETLTEAEFTMAPCRWFRLAVTGAGGNKAYTNAYPGGIE